MFVIQNFQISFVNTWSRPAPGRARAKTVVGQRAVNAKESSVAQYNFALKHFEPFAASRGETVEACIAFVSADGTIKDATLKAFNAFLLAAPARVSAAALRITTPAPARYSPVAFLAGPRASTRTASSGCSGRSCCSTRP